jgi:ABC-type multidrug transport system ATPase subunit/aminoglycoside phosphotransferase (APT) family kinase protein
VALVGPTGAGKSTLISLILRFHKPTSGKVYIDGKSTKKYRLKGLRRQVSLLPQEPFILGTSVRENLLYGNPEATDEELWDALKAVDLDDFVRSLPDGLDTDIRPRGQSLSGGQKQKVAVARAILKDAPILLLDEPTTGMDARTEKEVLLSLDELRRGRTTITIAHHFSTVRSADLVAVLDGGRLVETGPPEDLLSRESLFRVLAELQGFGPLGNGKDAPSMEGRSGLGEKLQPDPSVRGVTRLLREKGPVEFLESLSAVVDLGRDPKLTFVKQRVGQRAVIRIDGGKGAEGQSWFAKLQRSSKGEERAEHMGRIADEAGSLGLSVPKPVAYLNDFRALVIEGVDGSPALSCSREMERKRVANPEVFRRIGEALARVHHGLTPPDKPAGLDVERERLQKVLSVMSEYRPALLQKYESAVGRWWDERPSAAPDVEAALHGDFYPSQVLVGSTSTESSRPTLAFLDWDEACRGRPERDVGNFLAHITLEVVRRHLTSEESSALQSEFQSGYREVADLDGGHLEWYRRASLLRLSALHARPGFGADPPNPEYLAKGLLMAAAPGP